MKKSFILLLFVGISLYLNTYANVNAVPSDKKYQRETVDNTLKESGISFISAAGKTADRENAIQIYKSFLDGNVCAEGININFITVPTGEPDKRYGTQCSFFDSNKDGIPELHIKSARYYYIFTIRDNSMVVWKNLSPNPPFYALSNGAFISRKIGSAPMHNDYNYIIFDYLGNEIYNLSFSKYDQDGDSIYGDNDTYLFDWVNVSKEQWRELIKRYLYTDKTGIERIHNEIDWIILYE